MSIGRKWPTIDIVHLYTRGDSNGWNAMLTKMLDRHDVQGLRKTLYGLAAGMADAEKAGVVDDKMRLWFLRLQRSIEATAKKVFRAKYPHPLDDPKNAGGDMMSYIEVKRKRDREFESFLKAARF